ncbi:MAG: peptidylprolyl isomerase [Pseudomonadota bacterium]
MKSSILPIAGLIALMLAATPATAQTTEDSADTTDEAPAAEAVPLDVTADTVVSTIDEAPLTLGEVIAIRQTLPAQYQQLPDEVLFTGLVQQMIDQQMLANAAEAAGLDQGRAIQLSLKNQRRAVLADAYMAAELIARVNDEAIQATYDQRFANVEPVEEVRAAHILVEDEEKAKELRALLDGGADFAALAAEHGTDGTAARGGDLGYFTKEMMVPEFAEVVFAMQPGELSGPVKTPFGFHLIKMEDRRAKPVPPLAEVRDQIIAELTQAAETAILAELRASAAVAPPAEEVPSAAVRLDNLLAE